VQQKMTGALGLLMSYVADPRSALELNYSFAQTAKYSTSFQPYARVHSRQQEPPRDVYSLNFKRYVLLPKWESAQ